MSYNPTTSGGAPTGRGAPVSTGADVDDESTPDDTSDIDLTITDGRHRRSARSRRAIIDALLSLLREGIEQPSSTQIAERAGVTQRTLFNQFGDMQGVLTALWERQAPRVLALLPEPALGTLQERATTLAADFATLLEDSSPVRWALLTSTGLEDEVRLVAARFAAVVRSLLEQSFADELDQMSPERQEASLDALVVALDPTTWRLRRVVHRQSLEDATAALRIEVLALMSAPARAAADHARETG